MHRFEKYLIEQGFKPNRDGDYSSAVPNGLTKAYIKDGTKITFGLYVKGFPPTLLTVPNLEVKRSIEDETNTYSNVVMYDDCKITYSDSIINTEIMFERETDKDILDAIINDKTFKYDLT